LYDCRKWIFVTSPNNLKICLRYKVFGVDERYEITATRHISEGDEFFFYVKEKQVFCGPWRVKKKGTYIPNHPAVREWSPPDKYVIVIEIEPEEEPLE